MLRELLFGQCRLHRVLLLRDDVPVRYGLIRYPSALLDAWRREFPNARSFVGGGCCVGPDSAKTCAVRYCPECRRAEAAWYASHARGE